LNNLYGIIPPEARENRAIRKHLLFHEKGELFLLQFSFIYEQRKTTTASQIKERRFVPIKCCENCE
jgi:hypothetical protein